MILDFPFAPCLDTGNELNKNPTFTIRRKDFQIRIFVECCTGMEALEGSKCRKDQNINYEFVYYCHDPADTGRKLNVNNTFR